MTCVDLNDIAEEHLGNNHNVGIYQNTFGDQAEAACQNDHRDDVRGVFAWAFDDSASPSTPSVPASSLPLVDPGLYSAVWRGQTEQVRALVAGGANVNARTSDNDPVLHEAIFRGHTEIVWILVNAGVDVNANDSRGRSPLNRALFWAGDVSEIVRILLEAQSTQADLAWPTDCVELNDIVENHVGNDSNVGIYQRAFGDQAEQGCRNDHREEVRSVFT